MTTYGWGSGNAGALGEGTSLANRSSPVVVVGTHLFTQLECALSTSLGLKKDGSAWTWGSGALGGLGDNTVTDKSSPVQVVGSHLFTRIALGAINGGNASASGFGLKEDGSLWAWGNNDSGQLGDQTVTARSSPVLVVGNHAFIAVSTGKSQSGGGGAATIALKADGSAWTWGSGSQGIRGDNTVDNKSSPVAVVGAHAFTKVDMGIQFCMGLKADGSVWGWGDGTFGELGNQATTDRSSPVLVVGNHVFTKISAGCVTAYGLKADGSLWAWGGNSVGAGGGQLGDNTLDNKSSPVQVVGNHSFTDVQGGGFQVLAFKADGSAWGWGQNALGKLGDNTTTARSSPVLVVGAIPFVTITMGDDHALATTDRAGGAEFYYRWRGRVA